VTYDDFEHTSFSLTRAAYHPPGIMLYPVIQERRHLLEAITEVIHNLVGETVRCSVSDKVIATSGIGGLPVFPEMY
jgi:hypothetical protein